LRKRSLLIISFFIFFSFIFGDVFYYNGVVKKEKKENEVKFSFPYLEKFKNCGLVGYRGVVRKFEGERVKISIYRFQNEMDSFSAFSVFVDERSRFFEIDKSGFLKDNKIYVWVGNYLTISEFKGILKINGIRYFEWIRSQYVHKRRIPELYRLVIDLPYPIFFCRFFSNHSFIYNFDGEYKFIKDFPLVHAKIKIEGKNMDFFLAGKNFDASLLKKKNFQIFKRDDFTFFCDNCPRSLVDRVLLKIAENKNKGRFFFRRDNFTYGDLVLNGILLAFLLLFISIAFGVLFGFVLRFFKERNEEKFLRMDLRDENNEKRGNN